MGLRGIRFTINFTAKLISIGLLCVVMHQVQALKVDGLEHLSDITTKSQTRINTDFLLVKTLDKTKLLHKTYGEFFTYGAALFSDGSVKFVWYGKPGGGVNNTNKAIPFIRKVLQAQADSARIIGSAVVYSMHRENSLRPQLNVELEYYDGLAEVFSAEYTVTQDRQINWGRSVRKSNQSLIFHPESNKS